jgi:hypothetical protein
MPESFHDSDDIAGLLGWVELLVWPFDFAGGHLATIECRDLEFGGEKRHDVVELAAMAVASRDEDEEGTCALVPVVQGAVFIFDCGVGGLERHVQSWWSSKVGSWRLYEYSCSDVLSNALENCCLYVHLVHGASRSRTTQVPPVFHLFKRTDKHQPINQLRVIEFVPLGKEKLQQDL